MVEGPRADLHRSAVGGDGAGIGRQGAGGGLGDLIAPQPVAGRVQGEAGGGAHHHPPQMGGDGAVIADLRRRQHHRAAVGGGEGAVIGDGALAGNAGETQAPGQVVLVLQA